MWSLGVGRCLELGGGGGGFGTIGVIVGGVGGGELFSLLSFQELWGRFLLDFHRSVWTHFEVG